ncbi:50S ribosomal protein L10 [Candidatus Nomurabacteria bacterium]|jgi:large subunit ribosomal protein L10|nr:MAG: 50S ribosomal protein L10 [Candidatus Nomurabacteria bacterium]
MAISKQKKEVLLDGLTKALQGTGSIVFVKFNKLTVFDANAMRRTLQKSDIGYKVAKKTLLKRALETNGYTGTLPNLEGEIAVAYGSDMLAPAREVYEFQKTHKEVVSIEGGVFENVFKSKEEMMAIATIPGVDTLRGMFVNIINSPIQRLVIALDQISKAKA